MYKNNKNKNRFTEPKKNKNGVYKAGRQITHIPRTFGSFPLIPTQMNFALRTSFSYSRSAALLPATTRYGIFEFLSDTPQFLPQMYAIYKYAKLAAVDVHFEVVNTGAEPLLCALGSLPHIDSSLAMPPQQVAERPHSISKVVGGANGMNRAILSKRFIAAQELGQPVFDRQYWIDAAQSLSSTPVDANAPVAAASVGNVLLGGTSVTFQANVRVTYHVQFFDLVSPVSV